MPKTLSIREARKILDLDTSASASEIKIRFRELAKKHHPDRGGDAHEFNRIREAYDVLVNTPVDDIAANDVEQMIFDEIFNDWLGAQDDGVRETVTKQLNELENKKI